MRHQLPHVRPSEGPSRDRLDGDPQAPHASASSGRWLVKQLAWVGALSVLVLSACTVDEPRGATSSASVAANSQQSATPAEISPEDTPIVVVPVEPSESSGATSEPGRSEPVPDAALAAQMVCEPISRATRLSHESRWGPVDWDEAVQIAVGEGLTAGHSHGARTWIQRRPSWSRRTKLDDLARQVRPTSTGDRAARSGRPGGSTCRVDR